MDTNQANQQMNEMLSNRTPGIASGEELLRAYALGKKDDTLLNLIESIFSTEHKSQEQAQQSASSEETITGVTLYKPYPPKRYDEPTP